MQVEEDFLMVFVIGRFEEFRYMSCLVVVKDWSCRIDEVQAEVREDTVG